jgi:CheY-like chemotaxis protein
VAGHTGLDKIVIFLNDRHTRDLIANSLRFCGYDVFAEDSAAQSWQRICLVQPQLVITDFPAYVSSDVNPSAATLVEMVRPTPNSVVSRSSA